MQKVVPKPIDGRSKATGNEKAMRVRCVISGYADGAGGEFSFFELSKAMMLTDENLNKNLGEEKIREYI
jgi:hypothetical protein